ncbi:tyrosine-type recombinase/integrase [Nioella ostreopsis]|uniref:tyrosine-type recombinase/integrase n=1 Tax=Nioella ostreopsis TaxID=2448479 RepID=UPI000FD82F71|nr:integrase arm-type DNA-binding domain-containing protein [Nioella ostreopsis]
MPLTDTALRNARPRDRAYKLFDGSGLHVLVTASGSRLWRMKYRYRGREKLLSFGPYPLVSPKLAREKRDEARLMLLEDRDPSEEKQLARLEKDRERAVTFASVAEEYLDKLEREDRAPATMKKLRWLIGQTEPDLSRRPIRQIEAPDVLRVLKRVEAAGTFETTRRLRSTIGSVFRYAIASGRASHDPTEALKGALVRPKVQSRSALLDRRTIGEFLCRLDGFTGQPTTRFGLELLAILAPRPGELRQALWSEFDLDEAVWRVPAERMKMRRPHRVPLPRQAVSLLSSLRDLTGTSEYLLPSSRSWHKPISENTFNAALRRLGYTSGELSAHGFRATFSTFANESGLWNSDAVERALAHVEGNDVRRAYLRGEHWDERVRMAAWWADQLDGMKSVVSKGE